MLFRGDVDRKTVACGNRPILAFEVRIDGDKDQCADEFQTAPEFSSGRNHGEPRVRSSQLRGRIFEGARSTVKMAALRTAAHLDALQHLGLKGRTEAFGRFQ